jgi:NADH dehydrogenase
METKVLIIGSTGFIGRSLARFLLEKGYTVRCLSRSLERARDLAEAGCEVVQGDLLDAASLQRAAQGVQAVYVTVQTVTRKQDNRAAGMGFMDVEMTGLKNIVAAMRQNDVRRVVYVTTMGVRPDSPSVWTRLRWDAEEYLLHSGLDVTVIQPGEVIGLGGGGFDSNLALARRRLTVVPGNGKQLYRNIAVDDLLYYLEGVLNRPETIGQRYPVGCDELLDFDQMIDLCAEAQGCPRPHKLHVSTGFLVWLAPLLEKLAGYPKGGLKAGMQAMTLDLTDDPGAIRQVLPRRPMDMRQAVSRAVQAKQ